MKLLPTPTDEELDQPLVRSVGIIMVQGAPVIQFTEMRGDTVLSKRFVSADEKPQIVEWLNGVFNS